MNIGRLLSGLLVLVTVWTAAAQSTPALVRLAILAEDNSPAQAEDMLTAALSAQENVQLLERAEIEKIYREQSLSAAGQDSLKLGRIVGANGVLALNLNKTAQATNLVARLTAVKPGVMLLNLSFPWPITNWNDWSGAFAERLKAFYPKLCVLPKDAIPISVVNLRNAFQLEEARETERQLKLLVLQRLSRETRFFVLDREQLQSLSEENERNADESAFWSGSYLLEGAVDRNGYSADTLTLHVQLTPPHGSQPILFEASGPRTNLAPIINQLATAVLARLNLPSAAPEWTAQEEAAHFQAEAVWALKWRLFKTAQAAADSAWALGKRDPTCAAIRIRSYLAEASAKLEHYQTQEATFTPADGVAHGGPPGMPPTDYQLTVGIQKAATHRFPWGYFFTINTIEHGTIKVVRVNYPVRPPDFLSLDRALQGLQLYCDFNRTAEQSLLSGGTKSLLSDWHQLGVDMLETSSRILQNYNLAPALQKSVGEKLPQLRALSRQAAEWLSTQDIIRTNFFVGDRVVAVDDFDEISGEHGIFGCMAKWSSFWQESPEATLQFYHKLLTSPLAFRVHNPFWGVNQMNPTPRLVGWTPEDRQRIPRLWRDFLGELDHSTNIFEQLEANALRFADATGESEEADLFEKLMRSFLQNEDAFANHNVASLSPDWALGELISTRLQSAPSSVKTALSQKFRSDDMPKIKALGLKQSQHLDALKKAEIFEAKKRFLQQPAPFDLLSFSNVFLRGTCTREQAAELLPLLVACRSNVLAQALAETPEERLAASNHAAWIDLFALNHVRAVLEHSNSNSRPVIPQIHFPLSTNASLIAQLSQLGRTPPSGPAAEGLTNIVPVSRFLPLPLEKLQEGAICDVRVVSHEWAEGKLLLNLEYLGLTQTSDDASKRQECLYRAMALLNPQAGGWEVINAPEIAPGFSTSELHRTALLDDTLYFCNGNQVFQRDSQTHPWKPLAACAGAEYQLFSVAGHLYAANHTTICEITDAGRTSRILASTRRNPPTTTLDTIGNLGSPLLFEGPAHSLGAVVNSFVYLWTQADWQIQTNVNSFVHPEVCESGIVFHFGEVLSEPFVLYFQPKEALSPELLLFTPGKNQFAARNNPLSSLMLPSAPKPRWKISAEASLADLHVAMHQSDAYLLINRSQMKSSQDADHPPMRERILATNGYHAELRCYSHDRQDPVSCFLSFDSSKACPPVIPRPSQRNGSTKSFPEPWFLFTSNFVCFGLKSTARHPDTVNPQGVWMLPVTELESVFLSQRLGQERESQLAAAAKRQMLSEVLAHYDRNHNGKLDPDEKEAAIADPRYLAFELDSLDANHNLRLDLEELAWFDANTNRLLDPAEMAGLDIALDLLAQRLLEKFDANADGVLDQEEYDKLKGIPRWPPHPRSFPVLNHDGKLNAAELACDLKQALVQRLWVYWQAGAEKAASSPPLSPYQLLQTGVEGYWQDPSKVHSNVRGSPPASPPRSSAERPHPKVYPPFISSP